MDEENDRPRGALQRAWTEYFGAGRHGQTYFLTRRLKCALQCALSKSNAARVKKFSVSALRRAVAGAGSNATAGIAQHHGAGTSLKTIEAGKSGYLDVNQQRSIRITATGHKLGNSSRNPAG
jgi:hypothetical protein